MYVIFILAHNYFFYFKIYRIYIKKHQLFSTGINFKTYKTFQSKTLLMTFFYTLINKQLFLNLSLSYLTMLKKTIKQNNLNWVFQFQELLV